MRMTMRMAKIEQDIKDIKEAICIIRYYGTCDVHADGVVEAGRRLIEIVDKWEREDFVGGKANE